MGRQTDKLNRIFFGHPPKFLLDVPEDLTARAFALQSMHYDYDGPLPDQIVNLNFIKFIQDIYELDKDREREEGELSEYERMRLSGIFMRSEFHEWIQDAQKSPRQKLLKCLYYKGLLHAFSQVYGIQLITNQNDFLIELLTYQQDYEKKLEHEGQTGYKAPTEKTEIRFKEILTKNQQRLVLEHIKENKYVDNPELFVAFLIGKNDGRGINIVPGSEQELSYLLFELYKGSLIKLTSGKAYQRYLEMSLCPFSQQKEKGQIKCYVRKMQRGKSLKSAIVKDLSQFVKRVSRFPLPLFFVLLPLFSR